MGVCLKEEEDVWKSNVQCRNFNVSISFKKMLGDQPGLKAGKVDKDHKLASDNPFNDSS